jgi:hypothetical protein
VNVVRFPVLMFHLNEHVNMWRNRKTFLKWYSVVLLLAREDFLHASVVFHEHVYGRTLHDDCLYPFHPQHVQDLHPGDSAIRLELCYWLHTNRQLVPLILFTKLLSPITESTTHVTHIDGLTTIHMVRWKQTFNVVSLSECGAV